MVIIIINTFSFSVSFSKKLNKDFNIVNICYISAQVNKIVEASYPCSGLWKSFRTMTFKHTTQKTRLSLHTRRMCLNGGFVGGPSISLYTLWYNDGKDSSILILFIHYI